MAPGHVALEGSQLSTGQAADITVFPGIQTYLDDASTILEPWLEAQNWLSWLHTANAVVRFGELWPE